MTSSDAPTAWVVLLRGVNVGGSRRVSSADLREAAGAAGLSDARTYANSGNLVATGDAGDDDVAERVTAALAAQLGGDLRAVAVTAERAAAILAADPFPDAVADHPSHVQVHVSPEPADPEGLAQLAEGRSERFAVVDDVLYVDYVNGIGRSRLTPAAIDRAAGTWTTARNWNTLTRLVEMARETT
ncbi:DUF1697 domain-containing protein [Krasilnikoviella flava]|uniref:Uncharacterized conserved protein, DUF1697 family n=1 Tax=Krasilnikoviella flava TaxID=526729 RepID=A0A1T5JL59_9MICO|nr:DUF1697 domain-containing protein [Krasilnikoviella flava]SKC51982.1 Uncharacterized conserved protein, DUF1697 family [Krasilnikoviella flava]